MTVFVFSADSKPGSVNEAAYNIYKINIAAMYAVMYVVFMFILTWYSVADNMGEFCLQKGLAFINQKNKCSFNKTTAEEFFNTDRNKYECQHNCRVKLRTKHWGDELYPYRVYGVEELQLTFGSVILKRRVCEDWGEPYRGILDITCSQWTHDVYAFRNEGNCNFNCTRVVDTCICSCPSGYIMLNGQCLLNSVTVNNPCVHNWQCTGTEFSTVCSNGFCECQHGYLSLNGTCYRDNVVIGGACTLKEQCKGTEHSGVCWNGTCGCKTGYISIDQHCYEGNVSLDNKCLFHAQCSGSPNASCRDGYCTCTEGYVPDESSKCILSRPINDKEAFIGDQRESSLGSTLGALFGGVVLGALITTVIGFIIHKRIHQNYKRRQTQEPRVVFADNNGYGDADAERNADNASRSNKPNQRKIVNVPPYTPSSQSPEYGNISQTSRTKRANEDIYNHLNEKENPDDDDNYDHACAATGHMRGNFDSDYSSMRDVDKGYSSSVAKRTDD
uniref:Uncharacterized protein LOC111105921 isoform X1 n=1 Tax=Crassostrea virginica TaxID=6565 RepID=A0A8B8AY68_CRAVI|nr:uncharacterized protein LOC111105921 isoform X1 [Crassostrea virginica]XP_022296116.1 uncharacterized protein LOC111105921 isoform X1 [Crassostrea virginica]XP_022296117.1 uncharacterized protein LOC111105921 isoform X1 [Crassostrea virginica]XP_022296118.1 uncharacterized protein LOC111105921 isoform X1 [Crassostrea virginica]